MEVFIREKLEAQDTILDDTTRKQLICYGHVERMDSNRLPKIMINWKPEGRKTLGRPRRTWRDGMYTAMNERDLRMGGRMEQSEAIEFGRRKASPDVSKPPNTYIKFQSPNILQYIFT
jgi:hypothetical protein